MTRPRPLHNELNDRVTYDGLGFDAGLLSNV